MSMARDHGDMVVMGLWRRPSIMVVDMVVRGCGGAKHHGGGHGGHGAVEEAKYEHGGGHGDMVVVMALWRSPSIMVVDGGWPVEQAWWTWWWSWRCGGGQV
jgi:hypothetical protein